MIKIKFIKKNDNFLSFEISGHANNGKYGEDIVCAAVSATSTMVLNGLLEVMSLKFHYEYKDGYIYCDLSKLDINTLSRSDIQNSLKMLNIFLKELTVEYPRNSKFHTEEV